MSTLSLLAAKPQAGALIRQQYEDFIVCEDLGFEPAGDGEHAFLHLEKRNLNTLDLARRLSELSGVALKDIGYSGLKDRRALTSQWFSVGLAGRAEPNWQWLEHSGDVRVLAVKRHLRKLRRGVHRSNTFCLTLRQITGDRQDLIQRLQWVREQGVPNFFGEQRFGRDGATLVQARQWMQRGGERRLSRSKRSLYLSALRSHLFNRLLQERVEKNNWNIILDGDTCVLQGSRSYFVCEQVDAAIARRAYEKDIHPALPLWGHGQPSSAHPLNCYRFEQQAQQLADEHEICNFLETAGLNLDYRTARVLVDDFCWQFCDDDNLRLEFRLGAGSYATAVLAQLLNYSQGD